MSPPAFYTADELAARIEIYFNHIKGEFHLEDEPGKGTKGQTAGMKKIWDREPEPATITGLALFLGFNSRHEFVDYEENGTFAEILKRGCLSIEAMYEKRLYQPSPAGAIFALKSRGWSDKTENQASAEVVTTLEMKIIEAGPKPADREKDVIL
jgi:hypothetical protein